MLLAALSASPPHSSPGLPALVFVSREAPAEAGQVPGLGPRGSTLRTAGRLLRREADGRVHELLSAGRLWSAQDPDVSPDGSRIVFSGLEHPDSAWRLYVVAASGGEPRAITRPGRTAAGEPAADVDPCWFGDHVVFASTRESAGDLYEGRARFDLWAVGTDSVPVRLTHEANGALDPFVEPRTGRLGYSRWWFNPWRVGDRGTLIRMPREQAERAHTWRVVTAVVSRGADGALRLGDERLAAGDEGPRSGMGIQPASLADGSMVAVFAGHPGLVPSPAGVGVHRFAPAFSAGRRIAGLAVDATRAAAYDRAEGLAPPGACAPAALPDGRLVCAMDRGARGDFALWLMDPRSTRATALLDDPAGLELDPTPVVARRAPRVRDAARAGDGFTYANDDVFAGPGAPARADGARLLVWALRRDAGRDTAELLRSESMPRHGRIRLLALPEHTPLFEALLDARGQVLAADHGPAQVLGFNSGDGVRSPSCRGCHRGHSARR